MLAFKVTHNTAKLAYNITTLTTWSHSVLVVERTGLLERKVKVEHPAQTCQGNNNRLNIKKPCAFLGRSKTHTRYLSWP